MSPQPQPLTAISKSPLELPDIFFPETHGILAVFVAWETFMVLIIKANLQREKVILVYGGLITLRKPLWAIDDCFFSKANQRNFPQIGDFNTK